MSVDKRVALTSEVDGKTWYFCGPGCQEKFASSSGEPLADKSPDRSDEGLGRTLNLNSFRELRNSSVKVVFGVG